MLEQITQSQLALVGQVAPAITLLDHQAITQYFRQLQQQVVAAVVDRVLEFLAALAAVEKLVAQVEQVRQIKDLQAALDGAAVEVMAQAAVAEPELLEPMDYPTARVTVVLA